ncbi:MAG: hypothetical protein K1X52_11915 [Pyrinomonadaceae bacterium]|nr:hypothetical protein [Pyrinomonadaceae bacterium]MCC7307407.1 hypothetical protein [Acidobacteriota bacterium]
MDEKYKGMTVNERLWVSGQMDAYRSAIKSHDAEKVRSILLTVELTERNILPILRQQGLIKPEEHPIS